MTSLLEALVVGGLVGIVPLLLGFVPAFLFRERWRGWSTFAGGTAIGFLSLFFTDLIDDSGGLGESLGLALTQTQLTLFVLFFIGFALLVVATRTKGKATATALVAYAVAAGIGIHAMGEAIIIGNNLAGEAVVEDLSTLTQGLGFVLHKFLEGFTIALFLPSKNRLKSLGICTMLAGVPLILGIPLGFFTYPAILANFLFAAGAGAAFFIIIRVAKDFDYEKRIPIFAAGFLFGFALVYFASLIHFMEIPTG